MSFSLKRLLIGKPLATERAHEERLPISIALPIFASDALSSTAYATEEIMAALLLAGATYFHLTPLLSLGIVILLAIVVTSYRQTLFAYPSGGAAYVVARENLGILAAQAAGAALLVDYILTVAVSVSAGMAAIASLLKNFDHNIYPYIVDLCLLCVVLIAIMNLRGIRESGITFALPTYIFMAAMYALIGYGLYQLLALGGVQPVHTGEELALARVSTEHGDHAGDTLRPLGLFLLLQAFASGCTALTGTETISTGITAFKEPAPRNAARTMMLMAVILGSLFLGLSYLALRVNALPPNAQGYSETVVSQVGRAVFGKSLLYPILQIATCTILILAANAAFAGFPRLSAIQARDGFLPRQLANVGDKLVFNNGILMLALFSGLLIVIFQGNVHHLIPLYAVGVFLSFTLSQAGMVRRFLTLKPPGWRWRAAISACGACATCVVMFVFGIVKFVAGAWIVVFLIPTLVFIFYRINAHYRSVAKQLSLESYRPQQGLRHHMLVLASDIHQGVIPALQYARSLSPDAKAVHVAIDPARESRVRERWTLYSRGVPLVVLPSPYRSLIDPIMQYIDQLQAQEPRSLITVVVPEFVPSGWWPKLLHGQAGLMLALRLRLRRGVVVINVPYHIEAFVELRESRRQEAQRVQLGAGGESTDEPSVDGHRTGEDYRGQREPESTAPAAARF
ncbi:MAG: APC family permease [Armatimonadota bacterium]|nr:APC family permease [Armatimonadota bacterium]